MNSVKDAFVAFMQHDVYRAILLSTVVMPGNRTLVVGNVAVELFHNGTYRLLNRSEIGESYKSPGILIWVPSLLFSEWDSIHFLTEYKGVITDTVLYSAKHLGYFDRVIRLLHNKFDLCTIEF